MHIDDCEDNCRVMVAYSDVYLALLEHRRNNDKLAVDILEGALSRMVAEIGYEADPVLTIKGSA